MKILLAGLLACATFVASAQVNCTLSPAVSPLNEVASAGEDVTFTAVISGGTGPFNMYWANEKGQALTPLVGSNTALTLSNVNPSDAGLYFLVVYDLGTGCGSVTAGKLFVQTGARGKMHGGPALFTPEILSLSGE